MKHQQNVKKSDCEICGSSFLSEETLKIHMKGCQGKKVFVRCCYCKEVFSSESNMKRHMKETHPWCESKNIDFVDDLETLKTKCSICDKRFTRKSDLLHIKIHTATDEECQHKREKCNKEFLRE